MVIDDDKILDSNIKDERIENLTSKAAIYMIIMVAVSCLPLFFIQGRFKIKAFIFSLLLNTVTPLAVASSLELCRKRKREKKEKLDGIKMLKNLLRFEVLESAFSIFVLLAIVGITIELISAFL